MSNTAHTLANNNTFRKNERLCSKKEIEELFANGSSFYLYPFRIKFLKIEGDTQAPKLLFSIPKKKFKKAVDRNLLKRRLKEAYRLSKHPFVHSLKEANIGMHVAFIYVDKEKISFEILQNKLILVLARLAQSV